MHNETTEAENDNNNDYKQFKLEETEQKLKWAVLFTSLAWKEKTKQKQTGLACETAEDLPLKRSSRIQGSDRAVKYCTPEELKCWGTWLQYW